MNEKLDKKIDNIPSPERKETESQQGVFRKYGVMADRVFDRARNTVSRIFQSAEKRNERKEQTENKAALENLARGRVKNLLYNPGDGIVGCVSKDSEKGDKAAAVHAPGFMDCCGVVLQSEKGVAVLHVSPRHFTESGVPDSSGSALEGLIKGALTKLGGKSEGFAYLRPDQEMPDATPPEYAGRVTILQSDEKLGKSITGILSGKIPQNGIPDYNPEVVDCGTGKKTVYADKNDIFIVDDTSGHIKRLQNSDPKPNT